MVLKNAYLNIFYTQTKLPVLLSTSPFPCTCIKEAWLFLQLLAEKVDDRDFFWKCFNQAVDDMQKRPEKYALSIENIPEVIVFLLKGLVQLQGHRIDGSFEGTSSHRVCFTEYSKSYLKANFEITGGRKLWSIRGLGEFIFENEPS